MLAVMVRADGGAGSVSKADPVLLEALAREALGQDPEAVRRFLLAIAPLVGRACRGVMGTRHADIEDTIQETFIDVMRGLPSYRFEGALIGFVTKIAIRRALVSRRRSVARIRHLQLLDDLYDDLPNADANAGEIEQAELMRDLLRRVRPIQAETLVMRVVLGFSVEEIATATEVSVNTVKTRLRLGKKTLRELLTWQARQVPKEPT
jgi:RNA polymerase sigma-70 factor (ECF subfamily)